MFCIKLVLCQAGNGLTVFCTSLYYVLPNVAKFRVSLKFPENGGRFHHASVYCFTECHLYTTESLRWTMQFVLQCYFFEFGCLFWMVYKCPQLQAKMAKFTIWGMISVTLAGVLPLPQGPGQGAPRSCWGVAHCRTALWLRAVELLHFTAALPKGSGQWNRYMVIHHYFHPMNGLHFADPHPHPPGN